MSIIILGSDSQCTQFCVESGDWWTCAELFGGAKLDCSDSPSYAQLVCDTGMVVSQHLFPFSSGGASFQSVDG